jgi:hypothetical protein
MMRRPASTPLRDAVALELSRHRAAARIGDTGAAWWTLERAHILSQPELRLHLRVHLAMLFYALRRADLIEASGQAMRLALAPAGALTGRIPLGNTGRARISAFRSMPVPADLSAILARRERR